MARRSGTGSGELQKLLVKQADALQRHVQSKIPRRFQSVICAEDVLQETWIAACQADLDEIRDLRPWLTSVANSKLLDAIRAAQARKRGGHLRQVQAPAARVSSYDGLVARVYVHTKTPSRELSQKEARQAVQVALAGLDHAQRRAIHLHYIEGLSLQDIAGRTRKSKAAVNGLVFRGLRAMKERVGDVARLRSDVRAAN